MRTAYCRFEGTPSQKTIKDRTSKSLIVRNLQNLMHSIKDENVPDMAENRGRKENGTF